MLLNKKKHGLKFNWFISYLLIFSIPTFAALTIFLAYNIQLTKSNNELNHLFQDDLAENISSILSSVRRVSSDIIISDEIDRLLMINNRHDYFTSKEASELIRKIKEEEMYFSDSTQIYLYVKDSDMIVSKSGIMDSQMYYNTYFAHCSYTYDQWVNCLKSTTVPKSLSLYENRNKKAISYMFTVNKMYGSVVLSVETPENIYFPKSSSIPWFRSSDTYIFDADGNMILSDVKSKSPIKTPLQFKDVMNLSKEYGVLTSNISSDSTDWMLVSIIPNNTHLQLLHILKTVTTVLLILAIIFSIILLYVKTTRNYKPLSDIATMMNANSASTEYTAIIESIKELILANNKYSEEIKNQQNQIKSMLLSKMLNGYVDSNIDFLLSHYNIDMPNECFVVAIINSVKPILETNINNEVKHVITSIIQKPVTVNFCDNAHSLTAIFNITETDSTFVEDIKSHLVALDDLCKKYATDIKIAVSSKHTGRIGITKCYFEALDAISKFEFDSRGFSICSYRQLADTNYMLLSLQQENSFLTDARNHDFDKCRKNLQAMFNEIKNISVPSAKLTYIYDIVCMILKLSQIIDISQNQDLLYKLSFNNLIAASNDFDEFTETIFSIFNEIEQCNLVQNKIQNTAYAESILRFIEKNYADVNLSINTISEYIGHSSKHINNIFQNCYDISVHNFINKYRIEKAARLIESTEKIKDIYNAVGYSNARTFNRLFKQYYNMSPVEYRALKVQK